MKRKASFHWGLAAQTDVQWKCGYFTLQVSGTKPLLYFLCFIFSSSKNKYTWIVAFAEKHCTIADAAVWIDNLICLLLRAAKSIECSLISKIHTQPLFSLWQAICISLLSFSNFNLLVFIWLLFGTVTKSY